MGSVSSVMPARSACRHERVTLAREVGMRLGLEFGLSHQTRTAGAHTMVFKQTANHQRTLGYKEISVLKTMQ